MHARGLGRSTASLVIPVFAAVLTLALAAAAQAARPVTFEDLLHVRRIESVVLSPDGAWVLHAVRGWVPAEDDPAKKEWRSQLWRVSADGGASRQLTFDEEGAWSPSWSPDGRHIAFVSTRGGKEDAAQLWIMRADGGEAWQLTDAKERVGEYAWSPDGQRIAYVSREPLSAEQEARRKRGDDRSVYEDEFRYSHLWTVDVESRATAQLTEGAYMVRGGPSWSPDGTRVAFSAAPTPMLRDERADLYLVTVADRRIEKLTTNAGADTAPRWSPDGSTIAFLTERNDARPGPDGTAISNPALSRLAFLDVRTRAVRDANDPDGHFSPSEFWWSADGRQIGLTAGRGAYVEAFRYDVALGRYTQLTREQIVRHASASRDGTRVAYVLDRASAAPDVHVADASFASPRRVTDVNPQTRELALGESEIVRWQNEGLEIEGVLLKPVGYRPGARYPLLVVVHGGPAGAHLNGFRVGYGDGGQHWAGQGWAVLYPNPRGGTNYGEKFLRANIPDWGGGDYRDIMAGVDAMIARGVADPNRLAIQGWSYGGYMTAWAVTQTTRFRAAMVGAGLTNLWSMYGTNDIPNYLAAFFRGMPSRETLPLYMERSALTHVDKVRTPVLILHGGSDERVPIGQPMELHRALKDRGVPTELVFYPRQGHGLSEYHHQLDRVKRQYQWITKHTLGSPAQTSTQ